MVCEEAFKQPKIYRVDINADKVDVMWNLRSLKCLDYVGLCENGPDNCSKVKVRKSVHKYSRYGSIWEFPFQGQSRLRSSRP